MNKHRFRISKIFISKTNPEDTDKVLTDAALNGTGSYVCVTNIRMIRYADNHPTYAQLMEDAFMNLPDGVPLTWCGKAWGLKNIAVTNGPSIFHRMLSNGNSNLRHFLLGDTQQTLDNLKMKYTNEYGSNIVGMYSPPFCDIQDLDYKSITKLITNSGANIIWVAMTAPKQDEFGKILQDYLPNTLCIGVGRAFRLSIGEVKSAPNWAKKMGIGGLFMRRVTLHQAGWWYVKNSISVLKYIAQILFWRSKGRKFYE